MSDFKNTRELYEHLISGGAVKYKGENYVVKFKENGELNTTDYAITNFTYYEKYTEPKKKRTFYLWANHKLAVTSAFYDENGMGFNGNYIEVKNWKRLDFTATEFEVEG